MKRFILTVGPALLNEVPLTEVHDGRNIYRINGAHGSVEDVEQTILKIREQVPDADILMDEGFAGWRGSRGGRKDVRVIQPVF